MDYFTTPIDKIHDRAGFSCGEPALDTYIARHARQNSARDISKCYVHCNGIKVIGYYTLSAHTFDPGRIPLQYAKTIPGNYRAPAILIGRLAVDSAHKGQGIGGKLLLDAFRRVADTASGIGVYAVAVEAKDALAVSFYKHFGFMEFQDDRTKLFIPMATVRKTFACCGL